MTLEETAYIMRLLETCYPQYYKGFNLEEKYQAAELWAAMFADDSLADVTAAVKAFIAADRKGFPPHIGAIKGYLHDRSSPAAGEAWQLVRRALSHSIAHSKEEFGKLPPSVQRVVGSPSQLREWAMLEVSQVDTVIASNFQRAFREEAETGALRLLPAGG